jgi:hypothetical protein
MKVKLTLTLFVILLTNCYLSDLEEYKNLESHDDDILALNRLYQGSNSTSKNIFFFDIESYFDFSIKRTVTYDIYINDDTTKSTPLAYIIDSTPKEYTAGVHRLHQTVFYNILICADSLTIKARAISDVDTLVSYLKCDLNANLFCKNGGIDSTKLRVDFGNTALRSFINLGDFLSPVKFQQNKFITIEYSRKLGKPFILLLDSTDIEIDTTYYFIPLKNADSLLNINRGFHINSFIEYNNLYTWVDRESLAEVYDTTRWVGGIGIFPVESGKQFAINYDADFHWHRFVALIKIINVYINNQSGYADCVIYTLN